PHTPAPTLLTGQSLTGRRPVKAPQPVRLVGEPMKRTTPALVTILAAAVLGACSSGTPPAEPTRAVRTITLAATTVGGEHEYAADVRARTESRLGFRVGGKLLSRSANLGDTVRAGQVLAQLDP